MLIEVIPLDVSIDNNGLTYFAKNELKKQIKIWSIVSIPIKNNIKFGVVWKIFDIWEETDSKSIIQIICSKPILDSYQIKTIYDLSKKYFIHIHKVLNLFLPKFIFNALEKKAFEDMTKEDKKIENWKLKTCPCKARIENNSLLIYNYSNKKINVIIKDILKNYKECVFIFPDDFSVNNFCEQNESIISDSIIYKNKDTYNRKYKTFLDILYQTKKTIIWTRKILQYNLSKFKTLVYIEDAFIKHNFSYTHKYKNLDIFDFTVKNWNFNWIIITTIPSIESMYKAITKKYKLINL